MWSPSLRKVFSRPQRHTSAGPRRRQVRPTLQLLEDRVVQSNVHDFGIAPPRSAAFAAAGSSAQSAGGGMGVPGPPVSHVQTNGAAAGLAWALVSDGAGVRR
jgi:hypothetical protein